jgi:hypothetical protein
MSALTAEGLMANIGRAVLDYSPWVTLAGSIGEFQASVRVR